MGAEIEAEYMWGLLHPSLLSGEGGYYLTTLSSAVHVLKNFRACSEEQSRSIGIGQSLDVSFLVIKKIKLFPLLVYFFK